MSNSSLVDCTIISPNKTVMNDKKNDTITIHCMAGQLTAQRCGELFSNPSRKASSNYGIGYDGSVGLYVDEKDRSWCTSSKSNDSRAVTIEVSSERTPPYAVTAEAYQKLILLVADICKRNNIKKLLWKNDPSLIGQVDKQNMTVHRWFAKKACPGQYLLDRHYEIAEKVNQLLGSSAPPKDNVSKTFLVRILASKLNIRSGPGTEYPVVGCISKNEVFTIVETSANNWGKLKSGRGWISLNPSYVMRK